MTTSSAAPSLRSVPSYSSLSESSSAPPQYVRHISIASSVSSSLLPNSVLGPAHYATPESTSSAVKLICKLFPGSCLARKMKDAEGKVKQAEEKVMTDEEKKKHAKKVAEMLERDRILDHNLKMLGI